MDLVCFGKLIIGPLNQLKSPVYLIISISRISAIMWIGLPPVIQRKIALALFNNFL